MSLSTLVIANVMHMEINYALCVDAAAATRRHSGAVVFGNYNCFTGVRAESRRFLKAIAPSAFSLPLRDRPYFEPKISPLEPPPPAGFAVCVLQNSMCRQQRQRARCMCHHSMCHIYTCLRTHRPRESSCVRTVINKVDR